MSNPSTMVSPRDSVLVLVDLQDRLVAAMPHRQRVLGRAVFLARVAQIVGVPILVTRQYPKGLGETNETVAAAVDSAEDAGLQVVRVDKLTFDCFAEPEFLSAVKELGRQQLVIAGMESHICVCQTALTALRHAYDVHVVDDACCSRDDRCSEVALARLRSAGAVVTTSESVAYELVGQAGTPEFKQLLAVVKEC